MGLRYMKKDELEKLEQAFRFDSGAISKLCSEVLYLSGENDFFKKMLSRVEKHGEKYGIEYLLELRQKLFDAYYMLNNELVLYNIGVQDAETTLKDIKKILEEEVRIKDSADLVYEWSKGTGKE